MKVFHQSFSSRHMVTTAAVLLAFCLSVNVLGNAAGNSARQTVSVIAHLKVPGTPAREMRLQRENNRDYLYLLRSSGNGFTVVDVTRPNKPAIVKKVTLPQGSTENLDLVGSDMGIAEQSTSSTESGQPESIELLDLQDPTHPQPVQTFKGVTSLLTEDGRHLVYISNTEGLWILRRPAKPTTHPCTSSDAISGYSECD